jgi:hypothetical protein
MCTCIHVIHVYMYHVYMSLWGETAQHKVKGKRVGVGGEGRGWGRVGAGGYKGCGVGRFYSTL